MIRPIAHQTFTCQAAAGELIIVSSADWQAGSEAAD